MRPSPMVWGRAHARSGGQDLGRVFTYEDPAAE